MFAIVVLDYIAKISKEIYRDKDLEMKTLKLRDEIEEYVNKFEIVEHNIYGKIYNYEVNRFGNYNLIDDKNTKSFIDSIY